MKAQRHVTLEDAVDKIHQEMQEEQAEKANAMQQQQQPMQSGAAPQGATPEMQPGMGVSAENPIQGAPQPGGQPNLQDLLAQLQKGGGAPQGAAPVPTGA